MTRRSINKTLYNNVYSPNNLNNNQVSSERFSGRSLCGLSVYKFVFTSNVAFGAALLLCLSLLLQPISSAYAEETTELTQETEVVSVEQEQPSDSESDPVATSESETEVSADVIDIGDDEVDILSLIHI